MKKIYKIHLLILNKKKKSLIFQEILLEKIKIKINHLILYKFKN
jgi:hypothetical protein